jgi:cell division protein FtsI (penicillin-binding protein 3)
MHDKRKWEPVDGKDGRRLRRTAWFFMALIAVVLGQGAWIQIINREAFLKDMPRYRRLSTLISKRGMIYDRRMNVLAMDLTTYTLAADASLLKEPRRAAGIFADILGGGPEDYLPRLLKNRGDRFVVIRKDVTEEQKSELSGSGLKGLTFDPGLQRAHPCRSLALPVLGMTNSEHRGIAGIEQQMESVLNGENGREVREVDGRNRAHASPGDPVQTPRDGNHVVLTLDQTAQTLLEEELKRGVAAYRAEYGSAVLMDPFSGEILAMASVCARGFDDPSSDLMENIQNRAVQIAFEPGSTLKIVTAAEALEDRLYSPETTIYCENGAFRLAGRVIHDHDEKYGMLTFSQVLEYSSNIGITKITKKLGRKRLYTSLQNFGFGTVTAVDLPGEASGHIPEAPLWNEFTTASIGFGQGISATTLQIACMVSTVANGGELLRPRLVKSILTAEDEEIPVSKREVIRRVISPVTAGLIGDMLENAVLQGSGKSARVEGIRIAGKTGTAQKSVPGVKGYMPGTYTSSFAGFWPREAPRYTLVIVLEEPRESYYAALSAAPIFANVVERMVGLPTTPWMLETDAVKRDASGRFVLVSGTEGSKTLTPGSGSRPSSPAPRSETRTPGSSPHRAVNDSPYHVPDVVGFSLRQALQELSKRQIEARVEGEGAVIKQSPEPGRPIEPGMVCFLLCSRNQPGGENQ